MEAHELDDLVGIYEEDKGVKCRNCMEDEDWRDLNQQDIITVNDIKDSEEFIFCDYCEKKL